MANEGAELINHPSQQPKLEPRSRPSNVKTKLESVLAIIKSKSSKQTNTNEAQQKSNVTVTSQESLQSTQEQDRMVKSFKTAKGSTYTYDDEGKTTRFKTATGEQEERQDITVFAKLNFEEEQDFLHAYRHPLEEDRNSKIYVLQRQSDNTPKIIRDRQEITNPNDLYLGILKDGKWTSLKKASLSPVIGHQVFDSRHYQENGQSYTQRHLGNKVVEIEYEK